MLAEKHPGRPIVSVLESIFWGAIPLLAGAPGIKPTATLAVGVIPTVLSSIDCAPPGPGMSPIFQALLFCLYLAALYLFRSAVAVSRDINRQY